MALKKITGLLALLLLSGCTELKKFPQDFRQDFIGTYSSMQGIYNGKLTPYYIQMELKFD